MTPRLDYRRANPQATRAMLGLESAVKDGGLDVALLELVRMRVSQINGCAFCIDMHSKNARAAGESEQRLYALSAWRETPFFSERERAALHWAEAVTCISDVGVQDEDFVMTRKYFSEPELVTLTLAVIAINGWNRLAISFRAVPGTYEIPTDGHNHSAARGS